MNISGFMRAGLAGATVMTCALASPAIASREATQTLLDAHPGLRAMVDGERMIALYGVPFATDDNPRTSTDAFVEAFLAEHGDALGVSNPVLVFEDKINIRNDKFTVYTYSQEIEDLEVHASMVKIPVLLGKTEKIGYVGMRLFQPPLMSLPPDMITGPEAVSIVGQSPEYGHLSFTSPEKVIFEAPDDTLHRVWPFHRLR